MIFVGIGVDGALFEDVLPFSWWMIINGSYLMNGYYGTASKKTNISWLWPPHSNSDDQD